MADVKIYIDEDINSTKELLNKRLTALKEKASQERKKLDVINKLEELGLDLEILRQLICSKY